MKKGIRMGYHHNSDNTGNSHNNNNNKSNPWDPELYLKPIEELFKSNCYRCGIIYPHFKCDKCQLVHYCSNKCQKLHLNEHKEECNLIYRECLSFGDK